MSVEFLAPISAVLNPVALAATAQPPVTGTDFASWFSSQLSAVNTQLVGADHDIQKLAVGATENLHEVMIHLEEARLSFQLLAQVRNRLLESYQEVMRMQV
jgi:flagellar hook-basal body complex protein FliE